jgi:hypothetical protein
LDGAGRALAGSGLLASASDDLCDSSILDDARNPMRTVLVGCTASDPLLVNFQQMLIDDTQPKRGAQGQVLLDRRGEPLLEPTASGKESVIQTLTAGPVPRVRPFTHQPTTALAPGEAHAFPYRFAINAAAPPQTVRVRLLFRASPPYFLRALGVPALVSSLEVNEVARLELPIRTP